MKNLSPLKILIVLCFLFFGMVSSLHAFNRGAMLSPTRVVMEGRERAVIVKMINPEDKTNTYKVSLISMRMDEYGRRVEVKEPSEEERAVQKMIRFSPRRATVGPKGWQTIRIMTRKPADLAPGEYRAHLRVVPIPDARKAPKADGKGQEQLQVNLDVIFSITIPIIIRHGQGDVKITAQAPQLKHWKKNNTYTLETILSRTGLHSAYFDITAYLMPPGQTEKQLIGEFKGASFYTPNTSQVLNIPLQPRALSMLSNKGILTLDILDREDPGLPLMGSWVYQLD